MSNFWNQTWKQYDRIKETRGEAAAQVYLKKIVDRMSDLREAA
ncbi:MAG: hypothetical protein K0Q73_8805 [Paenibacillus sp.]|jgi:hypothetical protein|nr:hypothetical protein [Paenibacillus sp.]